MKLKKIAIILFVISLVVVIFSQFYIEYDYFWHVKAGEYIVENGIPFTDVFSWYAISNNLQWISHEWLFEAFIYLMSTIFKELTPYIYAFIFTALNFGMLFYLNKHKIKNISFFLLWAFCGSVIFGYACFPRPQLMSNIFLSLTLFLCFDLYNNKDSKKIFFLPIIALLWANFHGGSSNLIYLIPLLFIGTSLVNFKFSKLEGHAIKIEQIKKYLIVIVLSLLALLINPHTYQIILYPYQNMGDYTMISLISEWRSLDIKTMSHLLIVIIIFISYLILIITKKKIKFIDLFLLLIFTYMTFRSVRFAGLYYITATYIIFNYVDKRRELDLIGSKALILLSSIITVFYINQAIINFPEKNNEIISDEMINYLQKNEPQKLYNDYKLGGYLIYNDIKVFIDGRADMYSKYNLTDSNKLMYFNIFTVDILEKYDFDMLIMEKGDLEIYLRQQEQYEVIMEDKKNILFAKKK